MLLNVCGWTDFEKQELACLNELVLPDTVSDKLQSNKWTAPVKDTIKHTNWQVLPTFVQGIYLAIIKCKLFLLQLPLLHPFI